MKIINIEAIPNNFPTHKHESEFWECLGRTVATLGFLEEVLKKAILVFNNRELSVYEFNSLNTGNFPNELEQEIERFNKMIMKSSKSSLGWLKDEFVKSAKKHYKTEDGEKHIDSIYNKLDKIQELRNPICHGSWQLPDKQGNSKLFFFNRKHETLETAINIDILKQMQKHTAEVACEIINSVSEAELPYPGI